MANQFPTSLNNYVTGASSATLTAAGHAAAHNAYEAKIGTGSSTPTNNTVLRGNGTGTSTWAQVALTTDVTGTLPVANGGTGTTTSTGSGNLVLATSPTIVTPTIASLVNMTHTHQSNAGGGTLDAAAIAAGTMATARLGSGSATSSTFLRGDQTWAAVSSITTTNKARAYPSSNQSINDSTDTKVSLQTEDYDPGSNFDSATNYRFTIPTTGLYYISGSIEWGAGGSTGVRKCMIFKNGSVLKESLATTNAAWVVSCCDIFSLSATDYIELYGHQVSGGALSTVGQSKYTSLTVHLISL